MLGYISATRTLTRVCFIMNWSLALIGSNRRFWFQRKLPRRYPSPRSSINCIRLTTIELSWVFSSSLRVGACYIVWSHSSGAVPRRSPLHFPSHLVPFALFQVWGAKSICLLQALTSGFLVISEGGLSWPLSRRFFLACLPWWMRDFGLTNLPPLNIFIYLFAHNEFYPTIII